MDRYTSLRSILNHTPLSFPTPIPYASPIHSSGWSFMPFPGYLEGNITGPMDTTDCFGIPDRLHPYSLHTQRILSSTRAGVSPRFCPMGEECTKDPSVYSNLFVVAKKGRLETNYKPEKVEQIRGNSTLQNGKHSKCEGYPIAKWLPGEPVISDWLRLWLVLWTWMPEACLNLLAISPCMLGGKTGVYSFWDLPNPLP